MLKPTLAAGLLLLSAVSAAAQATAPPPPPALPSCPELAQALTTVVRNDARLRDWPALSRYRDANRTLGPAKAGEARVVFMGDSITDAWQQPRFGRFFEGRPYIDRGISGQTTPQMLVRFRPDVVALKPKAVVILAGTNDIAGNTGLATLPMIEDNFRSMTELAQANHIRVILASVLPVSDYPWHPGLQPASKVRALNTWLKSYAASSGATWLDYYSALANAQGGMDSRLASDGVHPTPAGYMIMAPLAQRAIERALAK